MTSVSSSDYPVLRPADTVLSPEFSSRYERFVRADSSTALNANPNAYASTWAWVPIIASFFAVTCALLGFIAVQFARQSLRLAGMSDDQWSFIVRAEGAAIISTIAAALLLEQWGRRVAKNHTALGRPDDRQRRRLPLVMFFEVASMAQRDMSPTWASRPRTHLGRRWSQLVWSSFLMPIAITWLVLKPAVKNASAATTKQALTRVSLTLPAVQAALLIAAAFVGIRAMVAIAGEQDAAHAVVAREQAAADAAIAYVKMRSGFGDGASAAAIS